MTRKSTRRKLHRIRLRAWRKWMRETKTQPLTVVAAAQYVGDVCPRCGVGFPDVRSVLDEGVFWPRPGTRTGHSRCYMMTCL